MGADNQAEKIIDRIERMERMQAEIEDLKLALIRATAENAQLKTKIDRLNEAIIYACHRSQRALELINEFRNTEPKPCP